MAKGKGNAHGFGEGDNVHDGKGSKHGSTGTPKVSAGGDAGASGTEKTHNVEFAKGGKTHMFGEQAAESATKFPGRTADTTSDDDAPGEKFASGGSGKMFGFNPAKLATAGITSAY